MSLSVPVRIAAAGGLAALLVAGCGGGGGGGGSSSGKSYSLSAAVSGLSGTVIVAQSTDTLTFNADGTSTFSGMLAAGSGYAVTVSSQPSTQYCAVSSGVGTIRADTTVDVTCNASAGGIWHGQSGDDIYLAMADEAGDFWLLDSNQTAGYEYLYAGAVRVAGAGANATVSGSDGGQALQGTFSDGATFGTGAVSGTLTPRSTATLTSAFTTTTPTQLSTQLALNYDSLYAQGSSLATIAHNYSYSLNENGTVVQVVPSISDSGEIFGQAPAGGCVISGSVSLLNSDYDMYYVQLSYQSCTKASGLDYLNGLNFSGIGAYQPADGNTPALFTAGLAAPLTTGTLYTVLALTQN